ncbi:MAG: hypothetical protein GX163_11400 [Bacteroidetes bacterium]|jgi:hypothetical protein|nr:hypothetical protein [Bacteroidota bacterium]
MEKEKIKKLKLEVEFDDQNDAVSVLYEEVNEKNKVVKSTRRYVKQKSANPKFKNVDRRKDYRYRTSEVVTYKIDENGNRISNWVKFTKQK